MESAGHSKCEKGLALIRGEAATGFRADVPERERARKIATLRDGAGLIRDGIGSYGAASEKTGKHYETTRYQEGLILARKMLMALRD